MEMQVLVHKATLTDEDHQRNEQLSSKDQNLPPLQVQYFGVSTITAFLTLVLARRCK